MNTIIVTVDLGVLKQLLKLPDEVELIKVRQTWDQEHQHLFQIMVSGPNLPETTPYHDYPHGTMEIKTEFCSGCAVSHIVSSRIKAGGTSVP